VPRFSCEDQLTTDQSKQSCATALRTAMQAVGATVDSTLRPATEATMGTQWFRLLGGILSSEEVAGADPREC